MLLYIVNGWEGRELVFPEIPVFTILGGDTIAFDTDGCGYRIFTYIDSTGCTSCKLQLLKWKELMTEFDSLIHNNTVFLFYFHPKSKKEILGKAYTDKAILSQTKILMDEEMIDLGIFDWQKKQQATFTLHNEGNQLLVINGVTTSCGCVSTEYNHEPIQRGKNLNLQVYYKADYVEHFDKTITVYCNAPSSPIKLRIKGNAQQIKP